MSARTGPCLPPAASSARGMLVVRAARASVRRAPTQRLLRTAASATPSKRAVPVVVFGGTAALAAAAWSRGGTVSRVVCDTSRPLPHSARKPASTRRVELKPAICIRDSHLEPFRLQPAPLMCPLVRTAPACPFGKVAFPLTNSPATRYFRALLLP